MKNISISLHIKINFTSFLDTSRNMFIYLIPESIHSIDRSEIPSGYFSSSVPDSGGWLRSELSEPLFQPIRASTLSKFQPNSLSSSLGHNLDMIYQVPEAAAFFLSQIDRRISSSLSSNSCISCSRSLFFFIRAASSSSCAISGSSIATP